MKSPYGYIQCDRHGVRPLNENKQCVKCVEFDLHTQEIEQAVNRVNMIKNKYKVAELFRPLSQAYNIRARRAIYATFGEDHKIFQLITIDTLGKEDRQTSNESYISNLELYTKLRLMHEKNEIYWNHAEDTTRKDIGNSPSLIAAIPKDIRNILSNTQFKFVVIAEMTPKQLIGFQGSSRTQYNKQFGDIFF
jgi:hypothetical protein